MRFIARRRLFALAIAAGLNASLVGAADVEPARAPNASAQAASDAAKADTKRDAKAEREAMHADVRRLLKLLGTGKVVVHAAVERIEPIRKAMPNVPAEFWDELYASLDSDELVERIIPVYEKYLTHDEVKELVKFHESPLGRKLHKIQPAMERDGMVVGREWGVAVGRQAADRIKAKGYANGGRKPGPQAATK